MDGDDKASSSSSSSWISGLISSVCSSSLTLSILSGAAAAIAGLFSVSRLGFLVRPVNTETGGVFLITPPLDVVFNNFFEDVAANVDDTKLPLLPLAGFMLSLTRFVGVTELVAGVFTLVAVAVADVGRVYIY